MGCTRSYGVHTALPHAVGVVNASPWKPVSILVNVTEDTLESSVTIYWGTDHIMAVCQMQFITCFQIIIIIYYHL